ncbi:MAG: N-acetyltransferase [Candidatus Omnitrophota bacterium]|nr:N-acetyltransferase [Candidatus Omnitrophota bacterium]MDP3787202.1 N-acetyltransferase [Candidatus Omnitrophota bacterium]
MVRKPGLKDTKAIHRLIGYYSKRNMLLPRKLNDICESIRDFWVYEDRKVLGCAALHVYAGDLAEIRSLAVDSGKRGKGIGGELLNACLDEAKRLGIKKAFALTLTPAFFRKYGFKHIDKSKLPQKIWTDCAVCSKFAKCDEVAYIKRL